MSKYSDDYYSKNYSYNYYNERWPLKQELNESNKQQKSSKFYVISCLLFLVIVCYVIASLIFIVN